MKIKKFIILYREFKRFVEYANKQTWKDAKQVGEYSEDENFEEVTFDNFMQWLENTVQ